MVVYNCISFLSRGIYQTVPIYGASSTVRRRFREGIHYIEYKAVDETGNFDSCSFSVSVSGECPACLRMSAHVHDVNLGNSSY